MATTATNVTFNDMLKEFMPYELLVEEIKRRNFFWNKVEKEDTWMGGSLRVPFEGAEASSLSFGNLTASNDIAENKEVLGTVSSYRELWGSMIFNERDLDLHGDMKSSFLKILPNKIDQFVKKMSDRVSQSLLLGDAICKLTATGGATGELTVDHPERLTIGEKVSVCAVGVTAAVIGYIRTINMNTKVCVAYDARTGGAVVNYSAFTVANGAALYTQGIVVTGQTAVQGIGFSSLKDALLSLANGGSTNLYGVAKTAYPYLQAQNISGAAITADNILEKLFDAFFDVSTLGKGMPTSIVCSMKHFKNCAKTLELDRRYSATDKAAGYGWRKVTVMGNDGEMEIIGVRDMDDSEIFILDWSSMKFFGSHFFDRKRHMNGDEFFLERATTGYTYIVDIRFYGDLVVHAPSYNGIVYGITY